MLGIQLPRFAQDALIQLCRHENAGQARSEGASRFQCPEPIESGHMDIKQCQMDVASLDCIQCFNPIRGKTCTVSSASQSFVECMPKGDIVVGNQNSMIRYVHGILFNGYSKFAQCIARVETARGKGTTPVAMLPVLLQGVFFQAGLAVLFRRDYSTEEVPPRTLWN